MVARSVNRLDSLQVGDHRKRAPPAISALEKRLLDLDNADLITQLPISSSEPWNEGTIDMCWLIELLKRLDEVVLTALDSKGLEPNTLIYLQPEQADTCAVGLRFVGYIMDHSYNRELVRLLPSVTKATWTVNAEVLAAAFAVLAKVNVQSNDYPDFDRSLHLDVELLSRRCLAIPFGYSEGVSAMNEYITGQWTVPEELWKPALDATTGDPWEAINGSKDTEALSELVSSLWISAAADDAEYRKTLVDMQMGALAVAVRQMPHTGLHKRVMRFQRALLRQAADLLCPTSGVASSQETVFQLFHNLSVDNPSYEPVILAVSRDTGCLWLLSYLTYWSARIDSNAEIDQDFIKQLFDTIGPKMVTVLASTSVAPALLNLAKQAATDYTAVATAAVNLLNKAIAFPNTYSSFLHAKGPATVTLWLDTIEPDSRVNADFVAAVLALCVNMQGRFTDPWQEAPIGKLIELVVMKASASIALRAMQALTRLVRDNEGFGKTVAENLGQISGVCAMLMRRYPAVAERVLVFGITASQSPGARKAGFNGLQFTNQLFSVFLSCDVDASTVVVDPQNIYGPIGEMKPLDRPLIVMQNYIGKPPNRLEITRVLASICQDALKILDKLDDDSFVACDNPVPWPRSDRAFNLATTVLKLVSENLTSDALVGAFVKEKSDILIVKVMTHPALSFEAVSRLTPLLLGFVERVYRQLLDVRLCSQMSGRIEEMARGQINECTVYTSLSFSEPSAVLAAQKLSRLAQMLQLMRARYLTKPYAVKVQELQQVCDFVNDAASALASTLQFAITQQALAYVEVDTAISVLSTPRDCTLKLDREKRVVKESVYVEPEVKQAAELVPEQRVNDLRRAKAIRTTLNTVETTIVEFFASVISGVEYSGQYSHANVAMLNTIVEALLSLVKVPSEGGPTAQRIMLKKIAEIWPKLFFFEGDGMYVTLQLFVQKGGIELISNLLKYSTSLPDDLYVPYYFTTGAEPTNMAVEAEMALAHALRILPWTTGVSVVDTPIFAMDVQRYGQTVVPVQLQFNISARMLCVLLRDGCLFFEKLAPAVLVDQIFHIFEALYAPAVAFTGHRQLQDAAACPVEFNPDAFYVPSELIDILDDGSEWRGNLETWIAEKVESENLSDLWCLAAERKFKGKLPPTPPPAPISVISHHGRSINDSKAYNEGLGELLNSLPMFANAAFASPDKGAVMAMFYSHLHAHRIVSGTIKTEYLEGLERLFNAVAERPCFQGLAFAASVLSYLDADELLPALGPAIDTVFDAATKILFDSPSLRMPAAAIVEQIELWHRRPAIASYFANVEQPAVRSWPREAKMAFLTGDAFRDCDVKTSVSVARLGLLFCLEDYDFVTAAVQGNFIALAVSAAIDAGGTFEGKRLERVVQSLILTAVETPSVLARAMARGIDSALVMRPLPNRDALQGSLSAMVGRSPTIAKQQLQRVAFIPSGIMEGDMESNSDEFCLKRVLEMMRGYFNAISANVGLWELPPAPWTTISEPQDSDDEIGKKMVLQLVSKLPLSWGDFVTNAQREYPSTTDSVRIYNLSRDNDWMRFKKHANSILLIVSALADVQSISDSAHESFSVELLSSLVHGVLAYTSDMPQPTVDPVHSVCESVSWTVLQLLCSYSRLNAEVSVATVPIAEKNTRVILNIVKSALTTLGLSGHDLNLLYMLLRLVNLLVASSSAPAWSAVVDTPIAVDVIFSTELPDAVNGCIVQVDFDNPLSELIRLEYQLLCIHLTRYNARAFPAAISVAPEMHDARRLQPNIVPTTAYDCEEYEHASRPFRSDELDLETVDPYNSESAESLAWIDHKFGEVKPNGLEGRRMGNRMQDLFNAGVQQLPPKEDAWDEYKSLAELEYQNPSQPANSLFPRSLLTGQPGGIIYPVYENRGIFIYEGDEQIRNFAPLESAPFDMFAYDQHTQPGTSAYQIFGDKPDPLSKIGLPLDRGDVMSDSRSATAFALPISPQGHVRHWCKVRELFYLILPSTFALVYPDQTRTLDENAVVWLQQLIKLAAACREGAEFGFDGQDVASASTSLPEKLRTCLQQSFSAVLDNAQGVNPSKFATSLDSLLKTNMDDTCRNEFDAFKNRSVAAQFKILMELCPQENKNISASLCLSIIKPLNYTIGDLVNFQSQFFCSQFCSWLPGPVLHSPNPLNNLWLKPLGNPYKASADSALTRRVIFGWLLQELVPLVTPGAVFNVAPSLETSAGAGEFVPFGWFLQQQSPLVAGDSLFDVTLSLSASSAAADVTNFLSSILAKLVTVSGSEPALVFNETLHNAGGSHVPCLKHVTPAIVLHQTLSTLKFMSDKPEFFAGDPSLTLNQILKMLVSPYVLRDPQLMVAALEVALPVILSVKVSETSIRAIAAITCLPCGIDLGTVLLAAVAGNPETLTFVQQTLESTIANTLAQVRSAVEEFSVDTLESVVTLAAPDSAPEKLLLFTATCVRLRLPEFVSCDMVLEMIGLADTLLTSGSSVKAITTIAVPFFSTLLMVYESLFTDPGNARVRKALLGLFKRHKHVWDTLLIETPSIMSSADVLLSEKLLDFRARLNQFYQFCNTVECTNEFEVEVNRDYVFEQSFEQLVDFGGWELRTTLLKISFIDEMGEDEGGLSREWFLLMGKDMLTPELELFKPLTSDSNSYYFNPDVDPDNMSYYEFVGHVLAKAIVERQNVDARFCRPLYKSILKEPLGLSDLQDVDTEYHDSLQWILDNDITDVIHETFSSGSGDKTVDLVENGRNIAVTEENKAEYVELIVQWMLVGSVKEQMDSLVNAFHSMFESPGVSWFDAAELELMICGVPEIDLEDCQSNTVYVNYTASSPQVKWLWRAIDALDTDDRAKLLQFWTGTSRVPSEGFKSLTPPLTVEKDLGSTKRLPSARTCSRTLLVPEYDRYEDLDSALIRAIVEGLSFGLV